MIAEIVDPIKMKDTNEILDILESQGFDMVRFPGPCHCVVANALGSYLMAQTGATSYVFNGRDFVNKARTPGAIGITVGLCRIVLGGETGYYLACTTRRVGLTGGEFDLPKYLDVSDFLSRVRKPDGTYMDVCEVFEAMPRTTVTLNYNPGHPQALRPS